MTRRVKPLPEGLSVQTVAAILDVNQITVRRWIHSGYIKAYRVGPQLLRIPRSEVARMRAQRVMYPDDKYPVV